MKTNKNRPCVNDSFEMVNSITVLKPKIFPHTEIKCVSNTYLFIYFLYPPSNQGSSFKM